MNKEEIDNIISINNSDELMDQIGNGGMIQPIIYLPRATNKDELNNIFSDKDFLHIAPVNIFALGNKSVQKEYFKNSDDVQSLKPVAYRLNGFNDVYIINAAKNYLYQNSLIVVTGMLDSTGKKFRSIIDYIPIKQYIDKMFKDNSSTYSDPINSILHSCIDNSGVGTYNYLSDTANPLDGNIMRTTHNFYKAAGFQISINLFSAICIATSNAINDVILLHESPNISYIIDNGCEYFNISKVNKPHVQIKHELYYYLNAALTDMYKHLFTTVIEPMCIDFCTNTLFSSFFYVYKNLDSEYLHESMNTIVNQDTLEDENHKIISIDGSPNIVKVSPSYHVPSVKRCDYEDEEDY